MILAVCGGKGGVGKSTVTLNLARELDAVAVDADLTTPDLPRGRGPDLLDVLADRASPMDAVEESGSVPVLPCRRSLAGARAADISELADVVRMVDRQYGCVMIDCPAGLARDVGHQIHSAHAVVLVTTPDRPALLNAFRTRHLAGKLDTPVVSVALNKVSDGDDIVDDIEEELGVATTAIPKRMEVVDCQESGTPLRDVRPECPAVDAFEEIAETIERSRRQITETGTP